MAIIICTNDEVLKSYLATVILRERSRASGREKLVYLLDVMCTKVPDLGLLVECYVRKSRIGRQAAGKKVPDLTLSRLHALGVLSGVLDKWYRERPLGRLSQRGCA